MSENIDFDIEMDMSIKEQDKKPISNNLWVTEFEQNDVISFIDKINSLYDENPRKPIVINITSCGGSVLGMFAMMDAMDAIRAKADKDFYFVTYATGYALSAGCDLLAHGDLRICSANTTVMSHLVSEGDSESDRLNYLSFEIFGANIGYTGSTDSLMKEFMRPKYMTPETALEYGIVDEIGFPVVEERDGQFVVLVKKAKGRRNIKIRRR
jgi:ATP-dependent protease ClpP protease subunit